MTTANSCVGRPRSISRIARLPRQFPADAHVAIVALVGLCISVLMRAPPVLEPDDFACRASIVALGHGHILRSSAVPCARAPARVGDLDREIPGRSWNAPVHRLARRCRWLADASTRRKRGRRIGRHPGRVAPGDTAGSIWA
jgi:hypothetical protein